MRQWARLPPRSPGLSHRSLTICGSGRSCSLAFGCTCPPGYQIGRSGAEGIRTPDLLNAIETRSQLRYSPIGESGGATPKSDLPPAAIRTYIIHEASWRRKEGSSRAVGQQPGVMEYWSVGVMGLGIRYITPVLHHSGPVGGSVWESNPPGMGATHPPRGFEDREDHQAPSAPVRMTR